MKKLSIIWLFAVLFSTIVLAPPTLTVAEARRLLPTINLGTAPGMETAWGVFPVLLREESTQEEAINWLYNHLHPPVQLHQGNWPTDLSQLFSILQGNATREVKQKIVVIVSALYSGTAENARWNIPTIAFEALSQIVNHGSETDLNAAIGLIVTHLRGKEFPRQFLRALPRNLPTSLLGGSRNRDLLSSSQERQLIESLSSPSESMRRLGVYLAMSRWLDGRDFRNPTRVASSLMTIVEGDPDRLLRGSAAATLAEYTHFLETRPSMRFTRRLERAAESTTHPPTLGGLLEAMASPYISSQNLHRLLMENLLSSQVERRTQALFALENLYPTEVFIRLVYNISQRDPDDNTRELAAHLLDKFLGATGMEQDFRKIFLELAATSTDFRFLHQVAVEVLAYEPSELDPLKEHFFERLTEADAHPEQNSINVSRRAALFRVLLLRFGIDERVSTYVRSLFSTSQESQATYRVEIARQLFEFDKTGVTLPIIRQAMQEGRLPRSLMRDKCGLLNLFLLGPQG